MLCANFLDGISGFILQEKNPYSSVISRLHLLPLAIAAMHLQLSRYSSIVPYSLSCFAY